MKNIKFALALVAGLSVAAPTVSFAQTAETGVAVVEGVDIASILAACTATPDLCAGLLDAALASVQVAAVPATVKDLVIGQLAAVAVVTAGRNSGNTALRTALAAEISKISAAASTEAQRTALTNTATTVSTGGEALTQLATDTRVLASG